MADETTAPAPKAKNRPEAEKKLVEQSRKGRLTVSDLRLVHRTPSWLFEAASSIHMWSKHEAAFARPMRLTGEDYEAALERAKRPNEKGEYVPHEAALSPIAKVEEEAAKEAAGSNR
jgi:hypothetical protein